MKKLLCLLLCLLLLLPLAAGCSSKTSNTQNDDDDKTEEKSSKKKKSKSTGDDTGDETDDEGRPIVEAVPDVNFEGEEFNILCRKDNDFGSYEYEITADEGATDTVNQAVYQRNRDICDMYGLSEINAIAIDGDWNCKDEFINKFKNSVDAQLHEFDLIMGCAGYMTEPGNYSYFMDFNEIPNLSLGESDYYYHNAIDELTVNGKLKYVIGDICLTYLDHTYVMYFNKQMAEENNLESIYALVNDGKWTIDKCLEMASGKWIDSNNDDWPGEEDTFGYISEIPGATDAYHAHFDVPRTEYQNGEVVIDMDVSKVTDILTKMIEFKNSNDCRMIYTSSTETAEDIGLNKIFMEGRALFYHSTLGQAQQFRSMKVDFGIVPYPMWDEAQGQYYTSANPMYSVACVPVDNRDLEMTGAVFETMSYLSYRDVLPVYYDKALKYKMTRDEESAQMLDVIRDGIVINFGDFYGWALEPADRMIRELIRNDNKNFASYYSSHVKAWGRTLSKMMEEFE